MNPNSSIQSTQPREHKLLHILVLLHALAISLPYAWAALILPLDAVWGGLLYSPDDANVHLSWARQARDGQLFARDLFTTENLSDNSRPLFFNALAFLIGLLSRITTLDVIFWYHAVRVASAILGLYALHALTKRWSDDWRVRISAVALAAFAGGAGWLGEITPQVLAGRVWIDRADSSLMMPEAWGFSSNFLFALNAASFALLCLAYDHLLRAREGDRKSLRIAMLAAFFLSNIHTYDALPLIAIIAIASLVEARRDGFDRAKLRASLAVMGTALVPIAWQVVVYSSSQEFKLKANTPTPAPPLLDLLLSYSPLLLLASVGIVAARKGRLQVLAAGRVWPLAWALVTLAMIYAPVSFARKMIEGLHLPLAFGAALGLIALLEKMPRTVRRPAWIGAVAALSMSMLLFAAWCVSPRIWGDNNFSRGMIPPLYLARGDANALAFLNALPASEKSGRAVLCYPKVGSYVPRAAGMSVYAGHWAETLQMDLEGKLGREGKITQLSDFYLGRMSADEARLWLAKNRIGWVLEGQYEKALGSDAAARYPFLKEAWAQGETKVFRVPD